MIFRQCPESWIAIVWAFYARFVEFAIKRLPYLCRVLRGDWNDPLFVGVIAVFAFLPQFFAGLVGGVSATLLTRVASSSSSRWCPCRWA